MLPNKRALRTFLTTGKRDIFHYKMANSLFNSPKTCKEMLIPC